MWEQLSCHTFDDQARIHLIFVPFFTPLHCEARKKEGNSGQKTLRQKNTNCNQFVLLLSVQPNTNPTLLDCSYMAARCIFQLILVIKRLALLKLYCCCWWWFWTCLVFGGGGKHGNFCASVKPRNSSIQLRTSATSKPIKKNCDQFLRAKSHTSHSRKC